MPVSKAERWLNLIAFLLARHYPVAREELLGAVEDYAGDWNSGVARRRESARRKFERDKRELRQLGVALETAFVEVEHTTQPVEGYLLRPRDFYLPYVEVRSGRRPVHGTPYNLPSVSLEPHELPLLRRAAERVARLDRTPLGSAGRSALRKLAFDLPELRRADIDGALDAGVPPEIEREFAELLLAVRERRAVRCRYYSIGREAREERDIEPYALMLSWGRWYCIARARDRQALRVFRVDRMSGVRTLTGSEARFTVPPSFHVSRYLGRSPWELSDAKPFTARIRVAFPQSRWVVSEGLGTVTRPLTGDGGVELAFQVRTPEPFLRWLLTFGSQAEVLSPRSLRRDLDVLRRRLRARYD